MERSESMHELLEERRMAWDAREHGWIARPEGVIEVLVQEGFVEYKRELTKTGHGRDATGGVWQGLRPNGSVASAIWVAQPDRQRTVVFIDVNGHPLEGRDEPASEDWWSDLDEAVMECLADCEWGEPTAIAERLGLSEEAVASVITMLVREGRVRICRVAAVPTALALRTELELHVV